MKYLRTLIYELLMPVCDVLRGVAGVGHQELHVLRHERDGRRPAPLVDQRGLPPQLGPHAGEHRPNSWS